jgi:hypothetical protein
LITVAGGSPIFDKSPIGLPIAITTIL